MKPTLTFDDFVRQYDPTPIKDGNRRLAVTAYQQWHRVNPCGRDPKDRAELAAMVAGTGLPWNMPYAGYCNAEAGNAKRTVTQTQLEQKGAELLRQFWQGKIAHLNARKPLGRPTKAMLAEREAIFNAQYRDFQEFGQPLRLQYEDWVKATDSVKNILRTYSALLIRAVNVPIRSVDNGNH